MHAMCLDLLAEHLRPGAHALDVGSGSGYLVAAMSIMTATDKPASESKTQEAHEEKSPAESSHPGASVLPKSVRVFGIEHIPQLVDMSKKNLSRWNPRWEDSITVLLGDGRLGVPGQSFDAIHVGAAAPTLPQALLEQLRPGGRLVIPVGPAAGDQHLMVIDKDEHGAMKKHTVTGVRYVPLTSQESQLRT